MTFSEWLVQVGPVLERDLDRDQFEFLLEQAYKSGSKAALEDLYSAEPVAWEHTFQDGLRVYYPHQEYLDPRVLDIQPMFRDPPPRQPLSDKYIDMITDRYWGRTTTKPNYQAYRQYVRAVEKAHGIM